MACRCRAIVVRPAGFVVRAVQTCRPCCEGPAGFLAVLGLIGVCLNSATPQTTPALIRSPLRSSATQKGSPIPHHSPSLLVDEEAFVPVNAARRIKAYQVCDSIFDWNWLQVVATLYDQWRGRNFDDRHISKPSDHSTGSTVYTYFVSQGEPMHRFITILLCVTAGVANGQTLTASCKDPTGRALGVLGKLGSNRPTLMATSNSPTFGQSNSPRQDG